MPALPTRHRDLLAHLMRGLWVVAIVASAGAAWLSIHWLGGRIGPWAAGLLGVALVASLHPGAILANFVLSRWLGDAVPPASRLSWPAAIRTWDQEIDASMRGLWIGTPFLAKRVAPRPTDVPLQALPLLFVHGYLCNRAVWLSFMHDAAQRGYVCEAVTLPDPFASIDTQHAIVDYAIDALLIEARTAGLAARQVVLVTHSMGGLVARSTLQHVDASRVAHVFTLGTPHRGTWTARFGRIPSVVQMRPGSPWVAALEAREASGVAGLPRDRYTSLYSHHDDIVFPQRSGALDGATQRVVAGVGHVALLYDRQVRTLVFERLAEIAAQETIVDPD